MTVPRILPLIGVAVVGALAINLLGGARELPQMLSAARAYAEGMATPDSKPAKGKAAKTDLADAGPAPATPSVSPLPPPNAAPSTPAVPVCAPPIGELAKSAGLSSGEMQALEQLKDRRSQIEAQGKNIDTQTQLLAAAEAKVDAKLKAMADLKGQIEALLGQTDQKTQAEVDRLTLVYSKMSAKQSAPLMAVLEDKVRIPLAAQLETSKPKLLADILTNMPTADGKHLTELLAHRFAAAQQLAENGAKAPPPATPPAATPAAKDTKAAKGKSAKSAPKTEEAAADPADANVDEKPVPKPKPRPKQVAKRAPAKKPAYKAPVAKKPVEEAKVSPGPHPYSEVKDASPTKPADKPAATPSPKT